VSSGCLHGLSLSRRQLDMPVLLELLHGCRKQGQRLVANLALNAAQAMSQAQGPRALSVRATREQDVLVLEVSDTGPGIAEEVRHRLFEPLATTRAKVPRARPHVAGHEFHAAWPE
jgi:C4-dicarboxylate-specific signal transduction histidine kinase